MRRVGKHTLQIRRVTPTLRVGHTPHPKRRKTYPYFSQRGRTDAYHVGTGADVFFTLLRSPSLALCLQWYNGLITPRMYSSMTKRTSVGLHYRP